MSDQEYDCYRIGKLGRGCYSVVYKAEARSKSGHLKERPGEDGNPERNLVAIKRNIISRNVNFICTLKELDLLTRLKDHPHIIKLLQVNYDSVFTQTSKRSLSVVSPPKGKYSKDDKIHFVLECADCDLQTAIEARMLDEELEKSVITQILLGVECLHKQKVIHRDLKPDNILLFKQFDNQTKKIKYQVKICDFGLSKHHNSRDWQSPGLVTVLYRAPEISLGMADYSTEIDIWSIGCIIYQMITEEALINVDGKASDFTILSRIIDIHPDINIKNELMTMLNRRKTLNNAEVNKPNGFLYDVVTDNEILDLLTKRSTKKELGQQKKKLEYAWHSFQRCNRHGPELTNLLVKMLAVDPKKRPTIDEILSNPFFADQKDIIKRSHDADLKIEARSTNLIKSIESDNSIKKNKIRAERQYILSMAKDIIDSYDTYKEYYKQPRIVYQSIDLYDRWLEYPNRDPEYLKNVKVISLCYYVCLYISMKLFYSTFELPRFQDLLPEYNTSEYLELAEKWEYYFVKDILGYTLYRNTYYDILDDTADAFRLTQFTTHLMTDTLINKETNISPERVIELYSLSKRLYSDEK